MKLAHLSDTHLGYFGTGPQRRVDDADRPGVSIRQQEADIFNGFRLAIDRIVDLRPDFVIHSGDLFDHAHPQPYVVDFAMRHLRRLSDADIPIIVVEGDHSCPRITEQGQILQLLLHLPNIQVVCSESKTIEIGGALIHAVPHRAAAQGFVIDLGTLDPHGVNILVAHAVADGLPFYNTSRHAASFAVRDIADRFSYVALGHCHRFCQVRDTDRAFYAGSTAMVAPGDFAPGNSFGFSLVEITKGAPKINRQELWTRPMHAYGLLDASGLSAKDVLTFLANQVESVPPTDAYCDLRVEGLDPLARKDLTIRDVQALFAGHASLTSQFAVRPMSRDEVSAAEAENSPRSRFQRLVEGSDGSADFKKAVMALGLDLLQQAQASLNSEDFASADE